jgi:hypothetical protein
MKIIIEIPQQYVPLTTFELQELSRMIAAHRKSAAISEGTDALGPTGPTLRSAILTSRKSCRAFANARSPAIIESAPWQRQDNSTFSRRNPSALNGAMARNAVSLFALGRRNRHSRHKNERWLSLARRILCSRFRRLSGLESRLFGFLRDNLPARLQFPANSPISWATSSCLAH